MGIRHTPPTFHRWRVLQLVDCTPVDQPSFGSGQYISIRFIAMLVTLTYQGLPPTPLTPPQKTPPDALNWPSLTYAPLYYFILFLYLPPGFLVDRPTGRFVV